VSDGPADDGRHGEGDGEGTSSEEGLDLTPRSTSALGTKPARKKKRAWKAGVVLALVLAGVGVLLFQGLANATVYFCNADEVGVRKDCSGPQRFRLQGTVDNGSIVEQAGLTTFKVTYNDVTIPVVYHGQPGGIFEEGLPVVAEGHLVNGPPGQGGSSAGAADAAGLAPVGTFVADRILVKHTEQYIQKHPDRVPAGSP
jgi:cytochrome c-type biogenesis protein CcmE